ncbi:MAG TPA: hypothetical protein VG167_17940 [Verrucomicrobiae bacterium]|nr:hypothetical protein [Verrucomicrobiae bacterium]
MDLPAGFFAGLGQRFYEAVAILIVLKDFVPAVTAIHEVVMAPGY